MFIADLPPQQSPNKPVANLSIKDKAVAKNLANALSNTNVVERPKLQVSKNYIFEEGFKTSNQINLEFILKEHGFNSYATETLKNFDATLEESAHQLPNFYKLYKTFINEISFIVQYENKLNKNKLDKSNPDKSQTFEKLRDYHFLKAAGILGSMNEMINNGELNSHENIVSQYYQVYNGLEFMLTSHTPANVKIEFTELNTDTHK